MSTCKQCNQGNHTGCTKLMYATNSKELCQCKDIYHADQLLDHLGVGNTESTSESEPMLRWFEYEHLSEPLRSVSVQFCELAWFIVDTIPRSPERTVALRKLLESKDAAVRAKLPAR